MCFNQEMSFAFAALGLFFTYYVKTHTNNKDLAIGVFFFFLMEFLQGLQYFVIDKCGEGWEADVNRVLTILGYLHICLQPYFTHVLNSAFVTRETTKAKCDAIKKLCLIGGALLFARFLMAPFFSTMNISPDGPCGVSTEWLRGEKICTFSGKYHLAWSVPMADGTYFIQGVGLHSFLMFAPFFVQKRANWIQGIFLFMTGPFLASWITPNLMEQASIWCFFSIGQIGLMLFLIRKNFVANKEKSKKAN